MSLKSYLSTLGGDGQTRFATACGTTRGHLRNVAYGCRPFSPELAAAAERESAGVLLADQLLAANWIRIPDPTWPCPAGRPVLDVAATAGA